MSMNELRAMLSKVKPGDYVTAFGKDTRGHEVTREGVLLAEPQDMKATHNGAKVAAVRAFVGAKGADPERRQTWVTLIPDHGFITPAAAPKAGEWIHGEIRNIPAVRSARLDVRSLLLWGGKGGKRSSEPTDGGTLAEITYAGSGRYEVRAVDSGEVLLNGALQSQVWWAHAPEDDEHQDQDEPEQNEGQDDRAKAFEEGRSLGLDHGEALDYAASQVKAKERTSTRTVTEHGQPVYHVRTGELVGYWTPERFTPIEELSN
ncbi:hypothetical protein [Streptomyces pseudogriseolus]|uniref:hypothetical protein n=1 Tax=Streptomyces pseudogriseolus TaxID=36817 RepID=UPI003FA265C4